MLNVLHILVLVLIVLVVVDFNILIPKREPDNILPGDAVLAAITIVAAIALFAYDKVVIG